MSFRRNILTNYISQFYITAIGILLVPLYIRYMGSESYGLVGFFSMLQAWFALLDTGLTHTIIREGARFNGGACTALDYRRLTRALEGIFFIIALLGGILLFLLAQPIAEHWLNAGQLPLPTITTALQLMAGIIALRWLCGLYRGIITGAERLIWLSCFNSVVATGRFILILPLLIFISASPLVFFGFQLGVAALELTGLSWMAYRLLPALPLGQRIRWEWTPLKPVLHFSLSIAFASLVWILTTQTDKLVLSRILPLADYGHFTVAALTASGIMILSTPISTALMPRMARQQAEGHHDRMIAIYRQATQLVTVIAIPAALVLIFFAPQVLWAWTGNAKLTDATAPVLSLYAGGYAFLVVAAFPFYLQYAKGSLRLHLIGSALFVLLLIPSIVWTTIHHGMIGAGWAWLVSNMVYFFCWTPLVHRQFTPGLHRDWLLVDVARPTFLPIISAAIAAQFIHWSDNRAWLIIELTITFIILLLLAYALADRIQFSKQKRHLFK